MFKYYNLYDFLATIVPGAFISAVALVIVSLCSPAFSVPELVAALGGAVGAAAFGFAVAFFAGHVLHPLGNVLEKVARKARHYGRDPGLALIKGGPALSSEFRTRLQQMIRCRFDVPPTSDDAYYLCYSYVRLHARDPVIIRLRALRGFYQQLTVGGLIGGLAAAVSAIAFRQHVAVALMALCFALLVVALAALARYLRFMRLFAENVLRAFYVLGVDTGAPAVSAVASDDATLAVDLDGVLATYSGWQGADNIGEPIVGAREFLQAMHAEGWKLVLWTARDEQAAREWLHRTNLARYFVAEDSQGGDPAIARGKPIAAAYLDDRAVRFEGTFEGLAARIVRLRPYWKPGAGQPLRGVTQSDAQEGRQ